MNKSRTKKKPPVKTGPPGNNKLKGGKGKEALINEIKPTNTDKKIKNKWRGSPKELFKPKIDCHEREPREMRRK